MSASHKIPIGRPRQFSPTVFVGRLLLVAASVLAAYLGATALASGGVAGCGEGAGCQELLASRWAYLSGLPVSLLGLGVYLGFLIADWRRCCVWFEATCGAAILAAAAYFFVLQAVVVRQFCPWCCTTHLLAVVGVLLIGVARRKALASTGWLPLVLAGAGVVAMVAIQFFGAGRETAQGASLGDSGVKTSPAATRVGTGRTVTLHGGKFVIDATGYPAIGNALTAEYVAVGLFDWTCPHCRELTETLTGIQKEFGDRLAVLQLPACFNANGCALQHVMMAVWREQPDFFAELAEMIHEGAIKPSAQAVGEVLAGRFGTGRLGEWRAEHEKWTQEQLDLSEEIRAENKKVVNSTRFPQIMIGDYVETGSNNNPAHYYELLRQQFGLARNKIPKIESASEMIALGTMVAGASKEFEFGISNPGKTPVKIMGIQLPAGMRHLDAQPETLAPGTTAVMRVNLVAPLTARSSNAEIVITSDAEPSALKIPVPVTVVKPFKMDPAMLNFKDFAETDLEQVSTLSFEQAVRLGTPLSTTPEYSARVVVVDPGKTFEIHVTANPNREKPGYHMGMISIPVTPESPTMPWPKDLQVRTRGRVIPDKPVQPPSSRP